jgi:hypothetical protein
LEVIDPLQGRVIVRYNVPGLVVSALPKAKAAVYMVAPDGTPRVQILSFAITGQ